ncbi:MULTISPECIES: hypothetical protein [Actinomycetes]|nr:MULTISPECIES: hypothetical protein [Actinomycetes]
MLIEAHQWFRAELRTLREQADNLADGSATTIVGRYRIWLRKCARTA